MYFRAYKPYLPFLVKRGVIKTSYREGLKNMTFPLFFQHFTLLGMNCPHLQWSLFRAMWLEGLQPFWAALHHAPKHPLAFFLRPHFTLVKVSKSSLCTWTYCPALECLVLKALKLVTGAAFGEICGLGEALLFKTLLVFTPLSILVDGWYLPRTGRLAKLQIINPVKLSLSISLSVP